MISVVVPSYNQGRFLSRAVESVWRQSVSDTEVIVVDDGSTDDTEDVLKALARTEHTKKLRWFRQPNQGPAAARNRGIRESRGEWVAFLDADDYWLDDKLKKQLQALSESDSDFAYCGTRIVDDAGHIVSTHLAANHDCLARELVWGNFIATPTVIVRRTLLDSSGLFDQTLRLGEDWDLWLRLSTRARGQGIPEPLVVVRYSEWFEREYVLEMYERVIPQVLGRFFDSIKGEEEWAFLAQVQRRVMSKHYSMLAKAHLKHRDVKDFFRYAARALGSSPRGFRYLLPSGVRG